MTDKKGKIQELLVASTYLKRLKVNRILHPVKRDVLREPKSTTRYLGTELLDWDYDDEEDEEELSLTSLFPDKVKS